MEEKVKNNKNFQCKNCQKFYSSQSSLCNHISKYHSEKNSEKIGNNSENIRKNSEKNEEILSYPCRKCNKIYQNIKSRWSHEKICANKTDNNETVQQQINDLKTQVSLLLQEKGKIHHKTLQKINNQLNNINNGTIINNTYIKFPNMSYVNILKEKEILKILSKQYMSLEESIKTIHFNDKFPEYNNIFITNLKDDLAYVFNGKKFIAVKKHEMLTELIDIHSNEINLSLESYDKKLPEKIIERLSKFLEKLNDEYRVFRDPDNDKLYPN